jgi:hypothetical protein
MNENPDNFVKPGFMKYSLSFFLVTAFVFSSCETDSPPPSRSRSTVTQTQTQTRQQYPPQTQPFDPNGPAHPDNVSSDPGAAGPAPAAPTKVAKGDYPYGIPVPNKPNLVESPFSPGKYVDVEGFAPGTEVKDPYTQKIFLVP